MAYRDSNLIDQVSSINLEKDKPIYQSLTGVLVDVSYSMKEAFNLDKTVSGDVERTHAIITTLNGIVKKESVAHDHRHDRVFVSAFGLKDINTCDLIQLLDYQETSSQSEMKETDCETKRQLDRVRKNLKELSHYSMTAGHKILIQFAKEKEAPHAERWIQRCLTEPEAGVMYAILSRDENLTKEFIEKLPGKFTSNVFGVTSSLTLGLLDVPDSNLQDSEAYKLAKKVIYRFVDITTFLQKPQVQIPKIWPVKEVSDLLDKILKKNHISSKPSHSQSFHYGQPNNALLATSSATPANQSSAKVKDLFDYLTPFIFGLSPLNESLNHAKNIFYQNQKEADKKVLFVLSDGDPTDGDPLPIAQELHALGVTVVTCFLTENKIQGPSKRLLDNKNFDFKANEGATTLFKMSSSMHNTKAPVSYFVDAGWELPTSGESKLFFQANSLDLVDEFCKIIFSHVKQNTCTDALVDVVAHVSTANYVNVTNSKFEPKEQSGKTCYANAIAAVYHLAMSRIVDREGGVPEFDDILENVTVFDKGSGGNTKFVIEKTCSKYRLKFTEVGEENARKAINERRPVIAKFKFNRQQQREFGKFFKDKPRDTLRPGDLTAVGASLHGYHHEVGHAVVLVRCEPNCLKFMNSWGQDWGDGGFFRIQNASVLREMKFFDVYWDEDNLYPSEKEAFKRKGADEAKNISQTFSSINELDYECPKCYCVSKIGDYAGNVLEAKCPKCRKSFKPDHEGLMQSLYISSRDYF